jgi:hypothetical protein
MGGPTRIRDRRVRLADNLADGATPGQIQNAIPSSMTEEDYQMFFLSRLREVIFGTDYNHHWYDNFEALGILPLISVSQRKTGIYFIGVLDGVNRVFKTPDKFVHANGLSIDVFHNGRRLIEAPIPDVRGGDFYCSESGGSGTGFDTINFLSFAPVSKSALVSDYQVAVPC